MMPRTAIAMLVLLAGGLAVGATPARAQSEQDGGALLAAGTKAIEAGQHQEAARRLSRAMRSNDLSPEQIAKALYLRGVAHRNMGKPAQAIADFTSALWLEGLSQQERARAYLNRGRAYQAVGMDERAKADLRRAGADEAEETDEAPAAAAERQAEPAQTAAAETDTDAETVASHANPAPQSSPPPPIRRRTASAARDDTGARNAADAPAPVPSFRTSIRPETTARETADAGETPEDAPAESGENAASAQRQPRPEEAASEDDEPSGTLTGFFGGLWSSATGEDDEEEAAGGTDNGRAPLASRWTQTTKVDRTAAAAERTPSPDAASTASSGNTTYRVQLAAVRSESEAQTAWDRLASEHETLLAGHEPVIEKSEGGASGPVYRVQVGPFADKSESAQLCNAFKNKGVDCFLVAR